MSMLPVRRSCLDRRQTVGTPRRARPGLSPSARSGARAPALGPVDIQRSQIMAPTRNNMAAKDTAVFS
jgi:hypothetical protein